MLPSSCRRKERYEAPTIGFEGPGDFTSGNFATLGGRQSGSKTSDCVRRPLRPARVGLPTSACGQVIPKGVRYTRSVLREARSGDFEGVVRLYRQLQPGDPVRQDGSERVAFEQILDSPGLHLFVLELNGVVVATTYLNVIPNVTRSASPYAVIENVVVEESLRRAGLCKQIMDGTLLAAWEAGCYKAMLMTGASNPVTHSFYRSCGFSSDAKTAYVARPPERDGRR